MNRKHVARAALRGLAGLLAWAVLALSGLAAPRLAPARAESGAASPSPTAGTASGLSPVGAQLLDIEFSIKPGEMVAPGDATMTFVITNTSGYDIQNVYLTSADGLLSEPIGQIGAGETQTLVRPHTVTQEELDAGLVAYTVSHDPVFPAIDKVSHPLSAPIVKGDPRPSVDFTRQVSSEYVAAGSLLTITYKICNTGNVAVSGVRLRDSLGDFNGRMELLNVGESKTFISRVTVNGESTSRPVLEYADAAGETVSVQLDPAVIRLSDSALETDFTVARSVFDPNIADAILTLANAGNSDFRDIVVQDDVYGGIIADAVVLPRGGEPVEVAFTYPFRGESQYRWRITGVSEAGEALDVITETVTLYDEPEDGGIALAIDAAARTPRINRAGTVTFDIEVANSGAAMAQDVLLYEINRGEVRRLAVLPPGEPVRCSARYEVRADAQFIFCLSFADADGRMRTISTAPIDVVIVPGGESPDQAEEAPMVEGGSVKMGTSSAFMILLAIASAALAAMFAILLIASHRSRKERRARIAAERRRIKEEMGKTNPFTPVKLSGERRKK